MKKLSFVLSCCLVSAMLCSCQQQALRTKTLWDNPGVNQAQAFFQMPKDHQNKPNTEPKESAQSTISEPSQKQESLWLSLPDPSLNKMLLAAEQENLELALASKHLALAQLQFDDRKIDKLPQARNSGRFLSKSDSQNQAFPPNDDGNNYQDHALTQHIDWEIDFFGRLKSGQLAAQENIHAQQQHLSHLQILVRSTITYQYYLATGLNSELKALKANIARQEETLKVVQAQLQSGVATPLDVARAKSQFYASKSKVLPLLTQKAQAMHRLASLTTLPIATIDEHLTQTQTLPPLPNVRDYLQRPEQLLKRRPDILAAQAKAFEAYAAIGQAKALRYPRINFVTDIGLSADSTSELIEGASLFHVLGLQVQWAGLGIKRVNNLIDRSENQAQTAQLQYQQSVQKAFEDVENALITYENTRQNLSFLTLSTESAKEASRYAKQQYEGGIISFLELLETEQQRLELDTQLAHAKTEVSLAAIILLKQMAIP